MSIACMLYVHVHVYVSSRYICIKLTLQNKTSLIAIICQKFSVFLGWNCNNFSTTTTTITTMKKKFAQNFLDKNEAHSLKSTSSVRRAISNSFVTSNSIFYASASKFTPSKIALYIPSALSIFVNDIININSQTFLVIWIYPIVVNLLPAATATVGPALQQYQLPAQLHAAPNICNKKRENGNNNIK